MLVNQLDLIACCQPLADDALTEGEALELERVFRALADRTRLKIVNLLAHAGEAVCVCALVPALDLTQPTVSYHLKQLAEAGIVTRERRGTFAFYELAPRVLERLRAVFAEPALAG